MVSVIKDKNGALNLEARENQAKSNNYLSSRLKRLKAFSSNNAIN